MTSSSSSEVGTSITPLALVKQDLKVTHDLDDDIIQSYIDGAEAEALRYMDRGQFGFQLEHDPRLPQRERSDGFNDWFDEPSSSSSSSESSSEQDMPSDVQTAILFLVRARYGATPQDAAAWRAAAETLMTPYRSHMGL